MPALTILKTGDLEPVRLEYGSLQIYLLTGVLAAVYLHLARQGLIEDPAQLPIFERGSYPMVYAWPQFYLAARMVSLLAGLGVVIMAYMLARRLGNQRQALFTAAVTAVTPMLVDNAHYATPDSLLALMVTLALYLLVRAYDQWPSDTLWAYGGAAFVCGLATSTKYNGAVLLVPLLLVPLLRVHHLDGWLRARVLAGPLAFLLGFFAATPYAWLNIPLFLQWAGYALRLYNAPGQATAIPSWQWHLTYLATSREAPIFILGALGFCLSWRTWRNRSILINGFALIYILAIIAQTNRQARMWLPLAPIVAAWAGLFLDWLAVRLRHRWAKGLIPRPQAPGHDWRSILPVKAMAFLPSLLLIPPLFFSARLANSLATPDVRTATAQWIETHIPPGTPVAFDYFPPNVDPATWPVSRTFRLSDHELAWYQEQDVQYLVFSQGLYDPGRLSPADLSRYEQLLAQLCPVATIQGPFLSNPGFTMRVYKAPPCS
jgi:hypothetical protein